MAVKPPLPTGHWSFLQPHWPPCSSPKTPSASAPQGPCPHPSLCLGCLIFPTQLSTWLPLISSCLCTISECLPFLAHLHPLSFSYSALFSGEHLSSSHIWRISLFVGLLSLSPPPTTIGLSSLSPGTFDSLVQSSPYRACHVVKVQ